MKNLADLLFPNVVETYDDILKKYPRRPEGTVCTRLAPSPTGFLHIGGVYTALINKKIASQNNGVFMLRIEDTDKKREVEGSIDIICKVFNKLNIKINEGVIDQTHEIGNYGPYIQSNRVDIYHVFAKYLVNKGLAYPCFCTEEELNEIRQKQTELKLTPGYYKEWAKYRNITADEAEKLISEGREYVLRFRVPDSEPDRVGIHDLIKGDIEMENNFNDFVLLKTDGIPTYHFAHAVDDFLMGTSHVIRGDEWVSSLPIHIQLFKALDFKMPHYAHVAPVMKQDGESKRKLSKRKDPESSAEYYLMHGYPVKALYVYLYTLINSNFEEWYLANPDKDINEFEFKFENMGVSGPLYDLEKLDNISKEIIYNTSIDDNVNGLLKWAMEFNPTLYERYNNDIDFVRNIFKTQGVDSLEHRKDLASYSKFMDEFGFLYDDIFLSDGDSYKEELYENVSKEELPTLVNAFVNYFKDLKDGLAIKEDGTQKTLKDLSKELNYTDKKKYAKNPEAYRGVITQFYHALRIMVTHKTSGISMDDVINVLGYDKVISRIENSL
ncbi:MAG: glutamate--tRNA ligase [Anaeroplasmataceae bacterium]